MKYILPLGILLFVLNSTVSRSQDLTAISETGTWVVLNGWPEWEFDPVLGEYTWVAHEEWRMYKSGGDTTISATTYKKLLSWPLNQDAAGNFTTTAPASGYHRLAYRNDGDRRAFRVMNGQTTEELWYDFNQQLGDTIFYSDQMMCLYGLDHYVVEVDSVQLCDSMYQTFQLVEWIGATPDPDDRMVQRVGTMADLIGQGQTNGGYYRMAFFCESPTNIEDLYSSWGIDETKELPRISLSPNPSSEFIHLSGIDQKITEILLMDAMGRVHSQIDTTSDQIDVRDLSKGLYYLMIRNDNGVQSVPFVKE